MKDCPEMTLTVQHEAFIRQPGKKEEKKKGNKEVKEEPSDRDAGSSGTQSEPMRPSETVVEISRRELINRDISLIDKGVDSYLDTHLRHSIPHRLRSHVLQRTLCGVFILFLFASKAYWKKL